MKRWLLGLSCLVLLNGAAMAAVVLQPALEIRAGDGSVRIFRDDTRVTVSTQGDVETWRIVDVALNGGADSFSNLVISFDPDPFIAFGGSLNKGNSGSTSYTFTFGLPTVGGPYNAVSSDMQAAALDATGASAALTGAVHRTLVDGVERLAAAQPNCLSNGGLEACGTADATALMPGPTNATPFFASEFTFTLSAPALYTFSGRSDLFLQPPQPASAPATLPLALLALAALGLRLRLRSGRGLQRR